MLTEESIEIAAKRWPRWMNMETAARYMGITKEALRHMMTKKLFPVIRRDRLVMFDREDIDRAMNKLKQ